MSGWPPPISASAARPGNFVRWARNQKLTTVDFPATRWAGPARVIDTEARWEQARWLLHDDGVRPEDRAAGLLVLLYAKQPPAISRLTLDHVQASGDEVRLMLGREPEPLASLILQVRARCPRLDALASPVTEFAKILTRHGSRLDAWIAAVEADDEPDLHSFTSGPKRDRAAVLKRPDPAPQLRSGRGPTSTRSR